MYLISRLEQSYRYWRVATISKYTNLHYSSEHRDPWMGGRCLQTEAQVNKKFKIPKKMLAPRFELGFPAFQRAVLRHQKDLRHTFERQAHYHYTMRA